MNNIYKFLVLAGIALIVLGGIFFVMQKFNIPLGRLPGDIIIRRENFSFYFPVTTCLIASIVIGVLIRFFRK